MSELYTGYVTTEMFLAALRSLEERLTGKIEQTAEHSATTRKSLDGLTETYEKNRVKDIYTFADQIERADHQSNLAKATGVLITGEVLSTVIYSYISIMYCFQD